MGPWLWRPDLARAGVCPSTVTNASVHAADKEVALESKALSGFQEWHEACPLLGMTFTSYITNGPNPVIAIPGTRQAGPFAELQRSMPSRTEAIPPLVDQLMRFINIFRLSDGTDTDVELALREAISNAVIHGNKNDENKRVDVVCRCGIDGEIFITVRDEGEGFDFKAVPDPTTPDNLLSEHGRGIYLMHALMDRVHFEDGGAVVQLRKGPASANWNGQDGRLLSPVRIPGPALHENPTICD